MRFMRDAKGAISIFLVIILVPMLMISSLFVDASRIMLAKSVAKSAGDLTLNTGLTNYDNVLKDMYGLFATAQDNDDLMDKLEDYYRTSITASGVSVEEADTYVEQIMKQLGLVKEGSAASDFLRMNVVEFDASKVENANLANPYILKSQIVNFMKYRGPINIGLSFLSSLKSLVNLSKVTKLVDKRKEYYEKQNELIKAAKAAWDNIDQYEKINNGIKENECNITEEDYYKRVKTDFEIKFEEKYKRISQLIIKDLHGTIYQDKCPIYYYTVEDKESKGELIFYTTKDKNKMLDSYKQYNEYSDVNSPKLLDLKEAIKDYKEKYEKNKKYEEKLLELYDEKTMYPVQYVKKVVKEKNYENYCQSMKELYNAYSRILHIGKFGKDLLKEETYKKQYDECINSFELHSTLFTKWINEYNKKFNSAKTKRDEIVKESIKEADKEIAEVHALVHQYTDNLNRATEALGQAVSNLQAVINIVKPGGELEKSKGEWDKAANDSALKNDVMAQNDKDEISRLKQQINSAEVAKLVDRLNKIKEKLDILKVEEKKFQYLGKELQNYGTDAVDGHNFEDVEEVIIEKFGEDKLDNLPIIKTELDSSVNMMWEGAYTKGKINTNWVRQSGTNPNLRKDPLKFYEYLYSKFKSQSSSVHEKLYEGTTKGLKESAKKQQDTKPIEDKGAIHPQDQSKGGANTFNNLPSKDKINQESPGKDVDIEGENPINETETSLYQMFSGLAKQLTKMGADFRDDLYVSDYIMNMFSYDTIDKEGIHNDKKPGAKDKKDKDSKKDIRTLTNENINKDMNYLYGSEVEYILYGNNESKENKNTAYGRIFGIRLGFNLCYAFKTGEIRNGAASIARPIAALTFIPAPLIQAVIIIGISIAESTIDINNLKDGKKVPLYKDKSTWYISFSSLVNNLGDEAEKIVGAALKDTPIRVINESQEILEEWLDKTDEELNDIIKNGGKELAKLSNNAVNAIDSIVQQETEAIVQKITDLIDAAKEDGKSSSDEVTAYIRDGLDSWLITSSEGGSKDSLAYKIKSEVVQYLKNPGSGKIKEIQDIMENAGNAAKTKATSDIKDISKNLQDSIAKISEEIFTTIKNESDSLRKYKDNMVKDINSAVKEGAGKLKESIETGIDGVFKSETELGNGTDKNTEATGLASLLSFQYSDYLRVFLMVGLTVNETPVILRTADIIQLNMSKICKNDKYLLKNSVTHIKINSSIEVKPLFLAPPIFMEIQRNIENNGKSQENKDENVKGYIFEYKGVQGY